VSVLSESSDTRWPKYAAGMPGTVRPIESLPNLGPKSAQMLRSAGIRTLGQFKRYGAVRAYLKAKAVDKRVSLNLLWALEAALSGRPWQDVAKNDRLRLLLAVEDRVRPTVRASPRKFQS
jgi:DNA transformation protein